MSRNFASAASFACTMLGIAIAFVIPQRANAQFAGYCNHLPWPYFCACYYTEGVEPATCMVSDPYDPCNPPDKSLTSKHFSDPVHMGSGEFRESAVDLSVPSRGLTIELIRRYRSQGGSARQSAVIDLLGNAESRGMFPFGFGWDHNHNVYLMRSTPPTGCDPKDMSGFTTGYATSPVAVWTGDGSPSWFKWNTTTGQYESPSMDAVLEFTFSAGCVETPEIRFGDGTVWKFNPYYYNDTLPVSWSTAPLQGRLSEVKMPSGSWLAYNYDTQGRLDSVVDETGRGLAFEYVLHPGNAFIGTSYLLESVTSIGDGRTVNYSYSYQSPPGYVWSSKQGHRAGLASAALPGGSSASPLPKVWSYTYEIANDGKDAWSLKTITDPKGQIVTSNTYSFDTLLGRRVVSHQIYGGDSYDYFWDRVAPGASPPDNRIKATSINRVGQKKELIYKAEADGTGKITGLFAVVSEREYTGLVTDRGTGSQGSKIRGGAGTGTTDPEHTLADPDYFETIHSYDTQNRLLSTRFPSGSGIKYEYESTTDPRRRHNVVKRTHMGNLTVADPSNDIVEEWTYDLFGSSSPGCGCSTAKAKTHKDPNGRVTTFDYDVYGNRKEEAPPSVTSGVYGGGSQGGLSEWTYGTGASDTSGAWPGQVKQIKHLANNNTNRTTNYAYYTSGAMVGYQASEVVDPGGLGLTTAYEYDAAGNVTRIIDPRGNDRLFTYDLANNLILEQSETATDAGENNRYDTKHFYDANNNRVRTDVEQMAGSTTHWITTITDYDVLNRPVRVVKEASSYTLSIPDSVLTTNALPAVSGFDPAAFSVTEYAYDDNGNPTSVVSGALGTTGGTPNALSVTPVTSTVRSYDERNLLFRETIGLGSEALTTQFNYDLNGNLISRIEGWGLGSNARRTDWVYNAYDRVIEVRDASSTDVAKRTRRVVGYDKAGNITTEESFGLADATLGTGSSVRMSVTTHEYDQRNRRILSRAGLLVPSTGALLQTLDYRYFYFSDGSLQATRDPRSSAAATAADATYDTVFSYDKPGRLLTTLDPKGNLVSRSYDANGNLTAMTTTEKSDVSGEPDQVFAVTGIYDTLDRMISTTDGVGNVTTYTYDARSNRITETDPRNAVTTWTYDGLNRETSMSMPVGGTGATILTQKIWDAASRLVAMIDARNNQTSYAFDSRDRLIGIRNHDGTLDQAGSGMTWPSGATQPILSSFNSGHNLFSDTARITDARGDVIDATHDKMGRLVSLAVSTFGSGVSNDTTWETFRYDGLGRLIVCSDNDSFNRFTYDSLGRLTAERSHLLASPLSAPPSSDPAETSPEARRVDYLSYDNAGNLTQLLYPVGTWDTVTDATFQRRRHLGYSYDALGRTTSITERSNEFASPLPTITTFGYIGAGRERFRAHANGTRTDRTYSGYNSVSPNPPSNPSGSFGFGRTLTVSHTKPGSPAVNLATFSYSWDRTQNRASTGFTSAKTSGIYSDATAYGYDNAERLTASTRTGGNWAKSTSYTLDGVHNRIKTNEGAGDLPYWMNDAGAPSGEPQDKQVNQYTRTPTDQNTYDLSGNLKQVVLDCKCDISSAAGAGSTDTLVNTFDLTAFFSRFGTTDPLADFDGDGSVGTADLTYLLSRFGRACNYETATWDYQNRLVSYVGTTTGDGGGAGSAGTKTHVYKYDALGRRIAKTADVGASFQRTERFVWGGQSAWQMLVREVTPGSTEGSPTVTGITTFVYQPSAGYIDDLLAMRRDIDGPSIPAQGETPATGTAAATQYWYHADDMFTVAALTDASGAVAERYHYDDYGSVRILDADFNLRAAAANGRIESVIGNPHGFTGREWDAESGLWQYRFRYMSSGMGRFISRDPLGYWKDALAYGSGFAYCGSSPMVWVDGYGLMPSWVAGGLLGITGGGGHIPVLDNPEVNAQASQTFAEISMVTGAVAGIGGLGQAIVSQIGPAGAQLAIAGGGVASVGAVATGSLAPAAAGGAVAIAANGVRTNGDNVRDLFRGRMSSQGGSGGSKPPYVSKENLDNHLRDRETAKQWLKELLDKLERTRKKYQPDIQKQIDKLREDIRGHDKEIEQIRRAIEKTLKGC